MFSFSRKDTGTSVLEIDVDLIMPNPYQPRKFFDTIAIEELANSIRQFGVIQPISVRMIRNGYELVSGERRLRACKQIGASTIPAIVISVSDDKSAIVAMVENLQRRDLSYLEEAEGYAHLIQSHGFTQEELASQVGKSQSTIANKLRLLRLSSSVRNTLSSNNLTERHARALLRLPSEEMQAAVLEVVIKKDMNVSATEEYIDKEVARIMEQKRDAVLNRIAKAPGDSGMKLVMNTLTEAVKMISKTGMTAKSRQIDYDDYIEYIIRIDKTNDGKITDMPRLRELKQA